MARSPPCSNGEHISYAMLPLKPPSRSALRNDWIIDEALAHRHGLRIRCLRFVVDEVRMVLIPWPEVDNRRPSCEPSRGRDDVLPTPRSSPCSAGAQASNSARQFGSSTAAIKSMKRFVADTDVMVILHTDRDTKVSRAARRFAQ